MSLFRHNKSGIKSWKAVCEEMYLEVNAATDTNCSDQQQWSCRM